MASKNLGFSGFAGRWLVALILCAAVFNPTGYSYFHWLHHSLSDQLPLKVICGVLLLIGLIVFLRATWRSIGVLGIVLVMGLMAALIWLLVDLKWLSLDGAPVIAWVSLLVLATVLAVGMSWSHVRRRISGQIDGDDVGD